MLDQGLWNIQICRVLKQASKKLSSREMTYVSGLLGDCLATATHLAKVPSLYCK